MRCIRLVLLFLAVGTATSTAHAQYPGYYPPPQPYPYPQQPYPQGMMPAPMQAYPQGMLPAQGQLPAMRIQSNAFRVMPWGPQQGVPPQGQVTYMPLTPHQKQPMQQPIQLIPAAPVVKETPATETHFSRQRAILAVEEGTPVYSGMPILTPGVVDETQHAESHPHDGHFTGTFGAYFLVPIPASNAALVRLKNTPVGLHRSEDTFGNEVVAAPRFSLGYIFGSGWGVRGSYSLLDLKQEVNTSSSINNPNQSVVSPLPNGFGLTSPSVSLINGFGADQFALNQSLRMHVWDIDFVKEHCHGSCVFLGGAGIRYARIRQGYEGLRTNPGGTNGIVTVTQDQESVQAINQFDGVGPTLFFEAKHRFGLTGLALYGNAHGSVLYGTQHFDQNSSTLRSESINGGAINVNNATSLSQSDNGFVPVGEFEIGLEYARPLGHAVVFIRGGFVGQKWFGLGSPTSPSGDLSFLGGSVLLGVNY
jgi:hypothetical protein